jgi:predicted ATPase
MKISEIKISNFRCFKELDLVLSDTHALVGENGCGKTAVLEAINLVTSGGMPHLNEQDFNNLDIGEITIEVFYDEPFLIRIPDGYTTQDIPCKSILMKSHRREKAAAGKALSEPFVVERYAIPIEYGSSNVPNVPVDEAKVNIPTSITKTANGFESPRKGGSKFTFAPNRLTLQNDTINLPDVFYFDRDREGQAKVGFNSLLHKIAKDLNWRYRKDWDKAEIEKKWVAFYDQVISTVEDPKGGRIIKPLREKLKKVAGVDFQDLELGLLDIEQPFSKTFFSRRDGTNQIEQNRFGSGISILLAYFLLETISKLTKGSIVFLIDEPELHLHPQLQYALFREFKESKFQTIYTTQSDCFISIAEWQSITRFSTAFEISPKTTDLEKQVESHTISEHLEEIKKWHQHHSIFFREDNQIFFAKKCLLVEGPAEKYGLPILAQKLGKDLDQLTIISCNGKTKIPYYQLLCQAFGIPFYTLFDLDGKKNDEGDNKRSHECADPKALSMFSTSFEKLFGIGSSADHKTSDVLLKIDGIAVADIPSEIATATTAISKWAK